MRLIDQFLQDRQVFAFEGQLSGEHEVEHDAGGEDVGASVKGLTLEALGSDVVDGADDVAGAREPGFGCGALYAGDAEVDDLRLAVGLHDHVGGLDVAMDDAALVRVAECSADLLDDAEFVDQRDAGCRRR